MDHDANDSSSTSTNSRFRIVQAGGTRFGLYAEDIAVAVPWQQPALLPHAPPAVLGVVSIQGRMLTVLDLKSLTSPESSETGNHENSFLIALRGDEQLALAVDTLGEEIQVGNRELQSRAENLAIVGQVLRIDDEDINILDVKQLFSTAIQGRERRRRRF